MRVRDVVRADAHLVEWGYCAWWEVPGIRQRVFLLAGKRVQPFGRARWRPASLVRAATSVEVLVVVLATVLLVARGGA